MIYVIGGEKGGTGKSCFAQNLVVYLQRQKSEATGDWRRVFTLDGDPQRTTVKWATKRARLGWAVRYGEQLGELYTPIMRHAAEHDDVVVDVAGADSEELRTALLAADRLITPVAPGESDLETVEDVEDAVKLIKLSGNPRLEARVTLNLCDPKFWQSDVAEAVDMLMPVLERGVIGLGPKVVCMRKPLRRAHAARMGVLEYLGHPDRRVRERSFKAMGEIKALCEWITGDFAASGTSGINDTYDTEATNDA